MMQVTILNKNILVKPLKTTLQSKQRKRVQLTEEMEVGMEKWNYSNRVLDYDVQKKKPQNLRDAEQSVKAEFQSE